MNFGLGRLFAGLDRGQLDVALVDGLGPVVAAGGATELFGIQPDMVCLAKALGAGLPTGAIGATDEVWAPVLSGEVYMVGTFNGNPLVMAAARANLERVMTPEAYARLGAINARLLDGAQGIIDRYRLAAYPIGIESKGVITFATSKVVDYESYKSAQQKELIDLLWLWNMNRGIFGTPGRDEEWTLSIGMDDADVAVSEVVRDLWRRERDRGLSAGEKRMLVKARQILVSELTFAIGVTEDEAEKKLNEALV